jgi:uncharacterized membrane protein YwzB
MGKLLDLVIFVIVVAVLWWALTAVLAALNVVEPFSTLAVVAFIVIAVFAAIDYLRGGTWFWRK